MTALNLLRGRKIQEGKIIYSEELEPKLIFAVIEKYEAKYEKDYFGSSSILSVESMVTTGELYTWSNGTRSLEYADSYECIEEKERFRTLGELQTKQGFRVWEYPHSERHFEKNGEKMKSRFTRWLVEVPKEELYKFIGEYGL